MEKNTNTIYGPELADCPEDGGKWILYCEHSNGDTGILQDTNKRRLAEWKREPLMWCCYCQEEQA